MQVRRARTDSRERARSDSRDRRRRSRCTSVVQFLTGLSTSVVGNVCYIAVTAIVFLPSESVDFDVTGVTHVKPGVAGIHARGEQLFAEGCMVLWMHRDSSDAPQKQ